MLNGSDGIPLAGRAEEYAAEMWLDDPSAFWLHPEGPLSETTPEEYRTKLAERERQRRVAAAQQPFDAYQNLPQNAYRQQMALLYAQTTQMELYSQYQSQLAGAHKQSLLGGMLGALSSA